jgi:hypothetical protein
MTSDENSWEYYNPHHVEVALRSGLFICSTEIYFTFVSFEALILILALFHFFFLSPCMCSTDLHSRLIVRAGSWPLE